jgi:hypothetical protein
VAGAAGAGGYDSGSECVPDGLVIVTDLGLFALGHQAMKLEWPTVASTLLPSSSVSVTVLASGAVAP